MRSQGPTRAIKKLYYPKLVRVREQYKSGTYFYFPKVHGLNNGFEEITKDLANDVFGPRRSRLFIWKHE